jgi:uncharacterized RDD family membrane protein YckC
VGLLAKLIVPFVYLILLATGLGIIVIPLIGVTVWLFSLYGKVAVLEWLGFKLGRFFGGGIQKPLAALLLGAVVIMLLYLIPVIGFLAHIIFGIWGLGSGVMSVFGRARRETPPAPEPPAGAMPSCVTPPAAAPPAPPVIPDENLPPASAAGAAAGAAFADAGAAGRIPPETPPSPPAAAAAPVAGDITSYPKASLWERLLASLLDIILLGLVIGFVHLGRYTLVIALAYFTLMWTWRGTSIGGLLFKLKVVRTDGRPLTFLVALVRGLAAAFSVIVLFLGFLWIAWDQDKQGWHDKIAGTAVVRLPQSAPLVCL